MVSNFQDSSPLDNCPDASGDDLKGNSKMNHHDLITIQQITNLVERGKSREEIAELIEVTIDSLQVTCSRLGISLRRPRLDNGIRLLPRGKPVPSNGRTTPDLSCDVSVPLQPIAERRQNFTARAGANPVHNAAPSRVESERGGFREPRPHDALQG